MHGDPAHPYAPPLPDEPFDVFEKVDGSLAIIFHLGGAWLVATKASFISEQAQFAQAWLNERDTSGLIPGHTYLAEIVYPGNRIIVDYGDTRELVLLGVYDPAGVEQPVEDYEGAWRRLGGRLATRYRPGPTIVQLMQAAEEDANPFGCEEISGTGDEGYVVRFRLSGIRAKIKYADYLRLHRKLTGITARDIWRAVAVREIGNTALPHATAFALRMPKGEVRMMLEHGDPLAEILENVPDEFHDWVRGIEADLLSRADAAYALIGAAYLRIAHLAHDRHEFTKAAKATPYPRELFLILDGKSVGPLVWGRLRPPKSKPFRTDDEA
jgi:RNA ligase